MKINFVLFLLLIMCFAAVKAQTANITQEIDRSATVEKIAETQTSVPAENNRSSLPQIAYTRPSAEKRFKRFVNNAVGPVALGINAFTAGVTTATNRPAEWGKSTEGFGRRFASNLGKNIIRQTAIYGLDEALKFDSQYYRSQKKSVGARLKNAVISPFTARKADGKRVLGVPRLVGTYTSSIIAAETWYPKRFDYRDGLRSGTISLGVNVLVNIFREFVWKK